MSLVLYLNFSPGGGAFYAALYLALVLDFALLVWYLSGRQKRRIKKILREETPLSAEEFEENWIVPSRRGAVEGYKYHEFPGCYVILIYDLVPEEGDDFDRPSDVYVGQSLNVTERVHHHFTGFGKGDVYADLKAGRHVYVKLLPCDREGLNDFERALIEEYHATESYNATAGGGTDCEAKERNRPLF
ncbi:MAG: hypothetical protein IJ547_00150 [Clostridia bacterium]|nr:hypothetical protein [Clostridia bacterium]